MLENRVSPPEGGACSTRRMLPIGGSTSHETSECHSSPDTNFAFSSACTTSISGCSASFGAAG